MGRMHSVLTLFPIQVLQFFPLPPPSLMLTNSCENIQKMHAFLHCDVSENCVLVCSRIIFLSSLYKPSTNSLFINYLKEFTMTVWYIVKTAFITSWGLFIIFVVMIMLFLLFLGVDSLVHWLLLYCADWRFWHSCEVWFQCLQSPLFQLPICTGGSSRNCNGEFIFPWMGKPMLFVSKTFCCKSIYFCCCGRLCSWGKIQGSRLSSRWEALGRNVLVEGFFSQSRSQGTVTVAGIYCWWIYIHCSCWSACRNE